METQVNKTTLTNPPKEQTEMTAAKKPKMYKLLALREFQVGKVQFKDGQVVGDTTRIVKPGEIVEVEGKKAKELCKKITGSYSFSGERHNADKDITRHDLTLARLATEADLVTKKPLTPIEEEDFED